MKKYELYRLVTKVMKQCQKLYFYLSQVTIIDLLPFDLAKLILIQSFLTSSHSLLRLCSDRDVVYFIHIPICWKHYHVTI